MGATQDILGNLNIEQLAGMLGVDAADGPKIVRHSLADDPQRLFAVQGVGGDLLGQVLGR